MSTTSQLRPHPEACRRMHAATMDLIADCGASEGVLDREAWEAAGCPDVRGAAGGRFIRERKDRKIVRKSLNRRMAENDWRFASTPGGVESLEACHSALEALHLWGELGRLSAENRRTWAESINRWQDRQTGYFLGPYVPPADHPAWTDPRQSHPWAHMHDHLLAVLMPGLFLLGAVPRTPLSRGSMSGRFLDRAYLEAFLERDWTGYRSDGDYARHNPWWMGNEFWYPACILWAITVAEAGSPAAAQARRMIDEVWYAWHDANFSSCGFWQGTLAGDPARLFRPSGSAARDHSRWVAMQAMGGAHQLWFYDFDGHPIPHDVRRRQTDALLALQGRDGMFGLNGPDCDDSESSDCTDVDCLTVLAYNHRRDDYRRSEIEAACVRAASGILASKTTPEGLLVNRRNQAWSHHGLSPETLSPADAPNLLQQSFYLWAILVAVSALPACSDPAVEGFRVRWWPRMSSHWLWVQ